MSPTLRNPDIETTKALNRYFYKNVLNSVQVFKHNKIETQLSFKIYLIWSTTRQQKFFKNIILVGDIFIVVSLNNSDVTLFYYVAFNYWPLDLIIKIY